MTEKLIGIWADGRYIISTNPIIRILEKESNKKGDLFNRLIGDLFLSLGYDQLIRKNIHKSGREIDIEVEHRTEPRRVIAECKATKNLIGGDEINKFVGALDAEKRKNTDFQITGYFISLSGFKETAIQQEKDTGEKRVILINGKQVVEELINGRIIVSKERVMQEVGRCSTVQKSGLVADSDCELLAHDIGWIWLVYLTQNKQRTHFVLIHADGEAIAPSLADNIIKSDMSVGGSLHSLTYLPPPVEGPISEDKIQQTKTKYFEYIAAECGEITLEGLPADQEVGSRRLKLENIFVPMYLEEISSENVNSLAIGEDIEKSDKKEREAVGKVLSKYQSLAILATPGGGKTTLIKRLAVAYAFPDRSKLVDDNLPDRPWLPLFIRCRQLGDMVRSPIRNILCEIPKRAEMSENTEDAFVHIVNSSFRNGNALLLIDGLDEISAEGDRVSFVNQLRTFLATYPNINIIVTSREAGFRVIGGSLSEHCKHYKVADFEDEDIKRLTLAWHKEVVGDKAEVRSEAEALAKTIVESDRVRQLAQNPLLLTTLLLVKRWVGQLPTRRSVLYGKAIEVLLMTWNVEGYEPIDQEEAIPQLAFIAFTMMKEGVQRISSKRLKENLILARKQMPEILGYARLSVPEFIDRIEFRSSLLMLSGHEIEEGTLYPMYEFRHLTFQEYLTARAVVDGYYPNHKDKDTLLTVLKPHLNNESWKEVIPIAAVLSGRKVQPLIQHFIKFLKKLKPTNRHLPYTNAFSIRLLTQCYLDEIQVTPDLLKEGLEWITRRSIGPTNHIRSLYKGKYGDILLKVIQDSYINSKTDLDSLGSSLADVTLEQIKFPELQNFQPQHVEKISNLLANEKPIHRAEGALAVMDLAFQFKSNDIISYENMHLFKAIGDSIIPLLYSDENYLQHSACWALVWLGKKRLWTPVNNPDVIVRLLKIWRESELKEVQDNASWAIAELPIINRELKPLPEPNSDLVKFIKEQSSIKERYRAQASYIVGFYWKTPWTDEELAQLIESIDEPFGKSSNIKDILVELEKSSVSGST